MKTTWEERLQWLEDAVSNPEHEDRAGAELLRCLPRLLREAKLVLEHAHSYVPSRDERAHARLEMALEYCNDKLEEELKTVPEEDQDEPATTD